MSSKNDVAVKLASGAIKNIGSSLLRLFANFVE